MPPSIGIETDAPTAHHSLDTALLEFRNTMAATAPIPKVSFHDDRNVRVEIPRVDPDLKSTLWISKPEIKHNSMMVKVRELVQTKLVEMVADDDHYLDEFRDMDDSELDDHEDTNGTWNAQEEEEAPTKTSPTKTEKELEQEKLGKIMLYVLNAIMDVRKKEILKFLETAKIPAGVPRPSPKKKAKSLPASSVHTEDTFMVLTDDEDEDWEEDSDDENDEEEEKGTEEKDSVDDEEEEEEDSDDEDDEEVIIDDNEDDEEVIIDDDDEDDDDDDDEEEVVVDSDDDETDSVDYEYEDAGADDLPSPKTKQSKSDRFKRQQKRRQSVTKFSLQAANLVAAQQPATAASKTRSLAPNGLDLNFSNHGHLVAAAAAAEQKAPNGLDLKFSMHLKTKGKQKERTRKKRKHPKGSCHNREQYINWIEDCGDAWVDLPTVVKVSATELGYTEEVWDNDRQDLAVFRRAWKRLQPNQRTALNFLGSYTEDSWNEAVRIHLMSSSSYESMTTSTSSTASSVTSSTSSASSSSSVSSAFEEEVSLGEAPPLVIYCESTSTEEDTSYNYNEEIAAIIRKGFEKGMKLADIQRGFDRGIRMAKRPGGSSSSRSKTSTLVALKDNESMEERPKKPRKKKSKRDDNGDEFSIDPGFTWWSL